MELDEACYRRQLACKTNDSDNGKVTEILILLTRVFLIICWYSWKLQKTESMVSLSGSLLHS